MERFCASFVSKKNNVKEKVSAKKKPQKNEINMKTCLIPPTCWYMKSMELLFLSFFKVFVRKKNSPWKTFSHFLSLSCKLSVSPKNVPNSFSQVQKGIVEKLATCELKMSTGVGWEEQNYSWCLKKQFSQKQTWLNTKRQHPFFIFLMECLFSWRDVFTVIKYLFTIFTNDTYFTWPGCMHIKKNCTHIYMCVRE